MQHVSPEKRRPGRPMPVFPNPPQIQKSENKRLWRLDGTSGLRPETQRLRGGGEAVP
jgi:hypothetical protein